MTDARSISEAAVVRLLEGKRIAKVRVHEGGLVTLHLDDGVVAQAVSAPTGAGPGLLYVTQAGEGGVSLVGLLGGRE